MYKLLPEQDQQAVNEILARENRLAGLSNTLKQLRDEAVKGRAASGIEAEWLEDEEYFQGIDDDNRDNIKVKPTSPDGRVRIEKASKKKTTRSTVFVNITRPYVNAAAAKLADILFPTDDSNYGMRPTPIPDLIEKAKSVAPAFHPDTGNPVMKVLKNAETEEQMLGEDGQPISRQATEGDVAKDEMEKAKAACEKAKSQIDDWLVECNYHAEGRQVIKDSARIGTGVVKGPFPESVRKRAVIKALEGIGMVIKDVIVPKSRRIDVWNLYPDPSCGESIHNGKFIFEYDEISAKRLQDLKRDPSYMEDAIDRILEEGPKDHVTGQLKRDKYKNNNKSDKEQFGIWYFYGYLSREDFELATENEPEEQEDVGLIDLEAIEGDEAMPSDEILGEMPQFPEELQGQQEEPGCEYKENEQVPVIATMVNDTIIKIAMQPLDSGEFPYDVLPWSKRSGHWAGIGVGRQMRTSQDGVNAATRNMMDNAGISGSPILIVDRSKIEPANGVWSSSTKIYYTTDSFTEGNIKDAFTWIIAPSMQQELMNIIQFWMQRAEEETGMPMLMQGQLGRAPDTVGGMTMLNNNANTVVRDIAKQFDDCITEKHMGRYYEWLLIHGEDDSMKGDFTVDARGSSALIERDMQLQLYGQVLQASMNPIFDLSPKRTMAEFLKAQRFDVEKLKLTDEEKKQMQQNAPPPDPRLQVAQLNADTRQQELAAKLAAEAQQADMDRLLKQWEKNIDVQIESMRMGGDVNINADNIKASLAKESAKLKTQMKLALMNTHAKQVATPAFEPIGRAAPGHAFEN